MSTSAENLSPKAILAISMVFIGCCLNVIFLELLVKDVPSCGNIVTFFHFLFIASVGFITTYRCRLRAPTIPIPYYTLMVVMFFVVQVVNNFALNFNISMPLHMIFRSGSLMANLVLGVVILKKSYPLSKYLSVLVITIGIIACTIASAGESHSHQEVTKLDDESSDEHSEFLRWCLGVGMLVFALFMSARMGIFQEETYRRFGKHPDEALFFNHFLPLPGFILLSRDLLHHFSLFSLSEAWLDWMPVPRLWLWLLGNVITQYICIRGVFILTTECSSLTVTLVVTLRKFISLLFSIFYFQNPFTMLHWVGTVCVFGGTLVFTETHTKLYSTWMSATSRAKLL